MLFILTNSQDVTASFLIPALEKSGMPFTRFDTDLVLGNAVFQFSVGIPRLQLNGSWYEPHQISHIWYRRPEEFRSNSFDDTPEGKYARAEWTEFFENFFAHVPKERWMNHPSANASASRKLEQLSTACQFGIKVPDTLVTQKPEELKAFYSKHGGRLIVKPLSSGYVERGKEEADSLIYTNQLRPADLEKLDDLATCPTLFQEFIKKDYDVRITVVDTELTAVKLEAKVNTSQDSMGSDADFHALPFMHINIVGSVPNSMVVKHLFQRALYNLGINAVKYGKPGGRLDIKLSEDADNGELVIDFEDDGIGVPEEDAELIFDEGYRGINVREKYRNAGEGFGLTIAREIIEAHKGTLELIRGRNPTVFRLTLPILRPSQDKEGKLFHPSIIRADRFTPMK